jgi:hypothetical protein
MIASVCALVMPGVLSADNFQGKVTMTITNDAHERAPMPITYYMKEGVIRVEMATERGMVADIMDFKNRQMIMIMDEQRMYMIQPLRQDAADQYQKGMEKTIKQLPPDVQVTTSKETILGYDCTKLVVTGKDGSAEIWVTDQLGSFMGLTPPAAGPGHRSELPSQWEKALKGKALFPLRVISKERKGTTRMDVTAVEPMEVPDSQFRPPEGYRKFDLGSMLGGALPGGFPGARPDGNN